MKILYVSDSTIPQRTANSIHVMKMCSAFSRIDHKVVLLSIKSAGSFKEEGKTDFDFYGVEPCFEIRKIHVPQMKYSILLYSLRCGIEVLKIRPDIVYGRCLWGIWVAAIMGFEVIYEMHYPVEQMSRGEKLFFFNLVKRRRLKHLVVISHVLKEMIKSDVSGKKIIVAHDGADLIDKDIQTFISNENGNRTKVGYLGHLYPGRGIELILKIASELSDIDFHIIGGTEDDIKTRKRGIRGNNIFFHGFIPPSLTNRYIRNYDIMIMPYQKKVTVSGDKFSDTSQWMSPLKMFEYMASGKPIIASDLPVLREVLEQGKNAILADPENIAGWVSAVKYLANNEDVRKRIAQQALIDLKQSYTWEKRAQKVLL